MPTPPVSLADRIADLQAEFMATAADLGIPEDAARVAFHGALVETLITVLKDYPLPAPEPRPCDPGVPGDDSAAGS